LARDHRPGAVEAAHMAVSEKRLAIEASSEAGQPDFRCLNRNSQEADIAFNVII
jgi:hypothetical protein